MIQPIKITTCTKNFSKLNEYISISQKQYIHSLVEELKECKVAHLNATAVGGGVAETLKNLVPYMNDLGITTSWYVMPPNSNLFRITKSIHNYIQGKKGLLSQRDKDYYLWYNQKLAKCMKSIITDIWIIHDPQPLASAYFLNRERTKKVWYCHIDSSSPDIDTWKFLSPYLISYDHIVFSNSSFIPKSIPHNNVTIIPPAIDPTSDKNISMPIRRAKKIIQSFGVDIRRPIIVQVSRFDPWKDHRGVIDAYRLAKKYVSNLQLIFVAQMAIDDPEAELIYKEIYQYADKDRDIFFIINAKKNNEVVNAFQTGADIIIQKSVKEGFGQTVTEAMWKKKTVIGGNATGIITQIQSGINGFIVNSIQECADKIIELIIDTKVRDKVGIEAYQTVRSRYLIHRLIMDYLALFNIIK